MDTAGEQIERRISKFSPGYVFSPKDLLDLGSRGLVDMTLSSLVRKTVIRRIGRGLYDMPRRSKLLGEECPPDMDQAAQAIARKHRWTITPHTAMAANLLGLSQQVPSRMVYLSDGPSRQIKVGQQTIGFRHASFVNSRIENYSSRLIAQALQHLGSEQIDEQVINRLRLRLPAEDKVQFLCDSQYATGWIRRVAQQLAEDSDG